MQVRENRRSASFDFSLAEWRQINGLDAAGARVRRDRSLEQFDRTRNEEPTRACVLVDGFLERENEALRALDLVDDGSVEIANKATRIIVRKPAILVIVQGDLTHALFIRDLAGESRLGRSGMISPPFRNWIPSDPEKIVGQYGMEVRLIRKFEFGSLRTAARIHRWNPPSNERISDRDISRDDTGRLEFQGAVSLPGNLCILPDGAVTHISLQSRVNSG